MPHFDLTIDGTSAMVARGEGTFKERSIRTEITQNILSQAEGAGLVSRPDQPVMYQTDWSGGAKWWKPIIKGDEQNGYFRSNHMDLWSEPGKVVPTNQVVDGANTVLDDNCVIGVGAAGAVYGIGSTADDVGGQADVYLWTPASNAFVKQTTYNSGVATGTPMAMVYDPSDGYFYIIAADDDIERFNPTTAAENANWITAGFTSYVGANIFLHNGFLMFYSGDQIYTVTKATPAVTSVFNDGMGKEFLSDISFGGTNPLFRENLHLAVATPEGLYYVKNTRQGGQPQAWVFRVDLDAAGTWLGNPIAVLPLGSVALSIAHHLGSIVISASPNWRSVVANDTVEAEIVLYHITQGSMGALGSVLGGRLEIDETPHALMGAAGAQLFIGGHKRLWVYDGIAGGLHTPLTWTTELANGPYVAMAFVLDSASASCMIFIGRDRIARVKTEQNLDPDIVSAFGDDETHYTLESNYFDLGLPMENKEIVKVAAMVDAGTTSQEWTVQLSTDDGAFADVVTHSTAAQYGEAAVAAGVHRGRLFRYKLIYQTKTAVKRALRAVLVTSNAGEMVREWEIMLDGASLLNVSNAIVRPAVFAEALRATAAKEQAISVVFNYQDEDASADTGETVICKVQLVEIIKDKPDEAMIHVVLREA